MSKLRTNQLETLDGLNTVNVSDIVDDIDTASVTTSTGTQTLVDALDARVSKGALASTSILEYIPREEHEAIRNHTSEYDCATAFNEAIALSRQVHIPNGTYKIGSTITAQAGTVLRGESKKGAIIEFLPSAVATYIPMLANRGYDTVGGYDADGDIEIVSLTWNDRGDLDMTNALGSNNALFFGHARNVRVINCYFPQHKYHAIDFTGCADSYALFNELENGKNSGIQVDQAVTGTNYNVFGDDTPCNNILIAKNIIRSSCHDPDNEQGFTAGIHFHRNGHRFITLDNNFIQGPHQGIFADPSSILRDIKIKHNTVLGKMPDGTSTNVHPGEHHYGIRLLASVIDSDIDDNKLEEWENGGAFIGGDVGGVCEHTTFTRNKMRGCGGRSAYFRNNRFPKIEANTVVFEAGGTHGFYFEGVDSGAAFDNLVIGPGTAGGSVGFHLEETPIVNVTTFLIERNQAMTVQTPFVVTNIPGAFEVRLINNKVNTVGDPVLDISGTITHYGNINYDSGWVALNAGTEINLTHGLTMPAAEIELLVALDSVGTARRQAVVNFDGTSSTGAWVTNIGDTLITVRAGADGLIGGLNAAGVYGVGALNGYIRVRATV